MQLIRECIQLLQSIGRSFPHFPNRCLYSRHSFIVFSSSNFDFSSNRLIVFSFHFLTFFSLIYDSIQYFKSETTFILYAKTFLSIEYVGGMGTGQISEGWPTACGDRFLDRSHT